jgi:hypothetical protein
MLTGWWRAVELSMRLALALAVMLGLVACGPPSAQSPAPSPPATVASPNVDPRAQQSVDAALRDAATQVGAASTSLTVERVEAREWSDSSLGCPRQGQMYAQVLTPGFLIVIGGGGRRLEYHSDERGRVVLCSQS